MGRICAIFGCSNSTVRLNVWLSQLCDIHGLKYGSCVCEPPFQLFTFPSVKKNPEGRKRWTKLVNRKTTSGQNWKPTEESRICSAHFKGNEPTVLCPDPTENLGYTNPIHNSTKSPRNPPKERIPYEKSTAQKKVREKKNQEEAACREKEPVETEPNAAIPELVDEIHVTAGLPESPPGDRPKCNSLQDHDYVLNNKSTSSCSSCDGKDTRIAELEKAVNKLRHNKSSKHSKSFDVTNVVLKSDKNVKSFTGIDSVEKLEHLHNHLHPQVGKMRYWTGQKKSSPRGTPKGKSTPQKPGPKRTLSSKQELILVLMKLRMALTVVFLGNLFWVSQSTASQIFNTWIKFLAHELKPLIFWPEREAVFTLVPKSLQNKYRRLRCTIDCTEVFIERPRDLEVQAMTWSDYKKHNTVKYLVAIAPNGMISFLSKAWGGRVSDVRITRECGFLNLIDPGDQILADRGFTIKEDLLIRRAELYIPPPSKGLEQQTPDDVKKTKKIANARIHVERAIGRMKLFSILQQTLPMTLVPLIDDIIIVCGALVNLQDPLVK